jgi:hypothetical protein
MELAHGENPQPCEATGLTHETLLLRQIHPAFVQDGRVTSQAFRPTPKDQNKLSVYDGDQIAPESAWRHYAEQLGLASIGVQAVAVRECETLALPAVPDPAAFPEHVLIDFTGLSTREIERRAKLLRVDAANRGWLFRP